MNRAVGAASGSGSATTLRATRPAQQVRMLAECALATCTLASLVVIAAFVVS
jgi:hypothetical protein